MRSYPLSPQEMALSLWRHHTLILTLTNREVAGRYKGSVLGLFWSFFHPLFMLCVYTFVFSVVFNARWGASTGSRTEFALVLFAGLIVFNFFADCISRAPTLVLNNINYVKKVIFPLEILPWVALLSSLFHTVISILVWIGAYAVFYGMPHGTILYIPVVFLPLAFFTVGVTWLLASLGVYLRDVSQFTGLLLTVLMFLSPIFYPATAIPEGYRELLYLNPLLPILEQTRNVLFWGVAPDFLQLGIYGVLSLGVAWLGFAWFQKTRKGFADVL